MSWWVKVKLTVHYRNCVPPIKVLTWTLNPDCYFSVFVTFRDEYINTLVIINNKILRILQNVSRDTHTAELYAKHIAYSCSPQMPDIKISPQN